MYIMSEKQATTLKPRAGAPDISFSAERIQSVPKTDEGRKAFVESLESLPFIKELERKGALTNLVYVPNRTEFEKLTGVGADTYWFDLILATTLPGLEGELQTPQSVLITRSFFEGDMVISNNEAVCTLLHEGKHIADSYWGIRYEHRPDIKVEDAQKDFIREIVEIRGYYAEFEAVSKGLVVSIFYLDKQLSCFREHVGNVILALEKDKSADNAAAAIEREVWQAQLEEMGDPELVIKAAYRTALSE
jgi:hypothetical protein